MRKKQEIMVAAYFKIRSPILPYFHIISVERVRATHGKIIDDVLAMLSKEIKKELGLKDDN